MQLLCTCGRFAIIEHGFMTVFAVCLGCHRAWQYRGTHHDGLDWVCVSGPSVLPNASDHRADARGESK
jgi:hypothetical protein